MIINNKSETVKYCRASQEPVLLLKKSGEVSELAGSSQVLGLFSENDFPGILNFEDVEIEMEKGDKLFLYTDGINEAQNKDEEFYGTDRLKYVLKENYRADAHEIVTNIFGDLKDFLEGLPILDDLTLMCIEKE
jgi:sigma-B regulation protein RsbU (phosphoserine phosphatase)